MLCRDCLVHLSFADIFMALRNIVASGSRYLASTQFDGAERRNRDIVTGQSRPLNLHEAPFGLPPALAVIAEKPTRFGGAYADKCLAAWDMAAVARATGPRS